VLGNWPFIGEMSEKTAVFKEQNMNANSEYMVWVADIDYDMINAKTLTL